MIIIYFIRDWGEQALVQIQSLRPKRGYKKDIATKNLEFIEVFCCFWGKFAV